VVENRPGNQGNGAPLSALGEKAFPMGEVITGGSRNGDELGQGIDPVDAEGCGDFLRGPVGRTAGEGVLAS